MRTVQWLDLAAVTPDGRRFPAVLVAIAAAWLTIVIAQTSGNAAALHHHALIEGGTPPAVAITTFLATWQIMVVAMMWPASLPAIRSFRESGWIPRPRLAVATFLGTSATVWASFGLAAFLGDMALHHVVDATPWLGARPWLIEAAVLAVAGGYRFMPHKRRYLAACRQPTDRTTPARLVGWGPTRLGLRHGFDCLGSSWALMLVMFGAGFGSLLSMAALSVLMAYEATGRHGKRAATVAGIGLLLAALTVLSGPSPGAA